MVAPAGARMKHELRRTQVVGGSLADVYAFFSDPVNLEALTPPWLGFRILDATDPVVTGGTVIRYRLRLHGIPVRWSSRIAEHVEMEMFADEQISGPYRHWYHRHLFRAVAEGVEITDIVEYALPFGWLGSLVHALVVRRQLAAIFDYRQAQMLRLFPIASRAGAAS